MAGYELSTGASMRLFQGDAGLTPVLQIAGTLCSCGHPISSLVGTPHFRTPALCRRAAGTPSPQLRHRDAYATQPEYVPLAARPRHSPRRRAFHQTSPNPSLFPSSLPPCAAAVPVTPAAAPRTSRPHPSAPTFADKPAASSRAWVESWEGFLAGQSSV